MNIYSTTFLSDTFLYVIFVVAMILLLLGFSYLRNSPKFKSRVPRIVFAGICMILSMIVTHTASFLLDTSFFIFINAISALTYGVVFLDYFSKKHYGLLVVLFFVLELALWKNLVEPLYNFNLITDLNAILIDAILPAAVIVLVYFFESFIKWQATRASLVTISYFAIGSIAYSATLGIDFSQVWVVSLLITSIFIGIILSLTSITDKYLKNLYVEDASISGILKKNEIIKYSQAATALRQFNKEEKTKYSPFLLFRFSEIYKYRHKTSYFRQYDVMFNYMRAVEKSFLTTMPDVKYLVFEAGYYEFVLYISMPSVHSKDLIELKQGKEMGEIEELKRLNTLRERLKNIKFHLELPDIKEPINVAPLLGISFYGIQGEIFSDLYFQATTNIKPLTSQLPDFYSQKSSYAKSTFRFMRNESDEMLNSPLLNIALKEVYVVRQNGNRLLGATVVYNFKGNFPEIFNKLTIDEKALLYSHKSFIFLNELANDAHYENVFITLPASYFSSNLFSGQLFASKLDRIQGRIKSKIHVIIKIDTDEKKAFDSIKILRQIGVELCIQGEPQKDSFMYGYIFEKDAEFIVDEVIYAKDNSLLSSNSQNKKLSSYLIN